MFMFIDKNFSEVGHLQALGFLTFHVQGCFFWLKTHGRRPLAEEL